MSSSILESSISRTADMITGLWQAALANLARGALRWPAHASYQQSLSADQPRSGQPGTRCDGSDAVRQGR